MNAPDDPMAELYERCALALDAAAQRPLRQDEIDALRYAAAIPEGAPRPVTDGRQESFEWH